MRAAILPLAVLLLSCSGDPQQLKPDDSGVDTSETGETDDSDEPPPVYPGGDRVLLYYGHGGATEDEDGFGSFEAVDAVWKNRYEWNADHRVYIPDSLSAYRAIFFIAPGFTGEQSFSAAELEQLDQALAAGTRMILLNERDGCALSTPNELLAGLGSSMSYTGSGLQQYQVAEIGLIAEHQVTTGVNALRFRDACYVDIGDGSYLARHNEDYVIGRDRPGAGGEIIVIGDFEFMDDSGPRDWDDNAVLADRLVEIDPSYAE